MRIKYTLMYGGIMIFLKEPLIWVIVINLVLQLLLLRYAKIKTENINIKNFITFAQVIMLVLTLMSLYWLIKTVLHI